MRRQDVNSRAIEGERVILDRKSGYVHHLNATASTIWDALDRLQSAEAIAHGLEDTFENPAEHGPAVAPR